jgi:DNA-binding SARP family transcriptional activator
MSVDASLMKLIALGGTGEGNTVVHALCRRGDDFLPRSEIKRTDASGSSLHLLGGFRLMRGPHIVPVRHSAARLIARLAIKGPHPRADIAPHLWPDSPAEVALGDLRTVLTRARAEVAGLIIEEGRALRLATPECDVLTVRKWAVDVLNEVDSGTYPRGLGEELLPTWEDAWLIEEREELRLLQLHALDALGQRLLASGLLSRAARAAMAAVRIDPLRESANRLLIEIHLRQGNELDAVKRFRRYEALLRSEVGLIPGPAVRTLIAPILGGRVIPQSDPLPSRR